MKLKAANRKLQDSFEIDRRISLPSVASHSQRSCQNRQGWFLSDRDSILDARQRIPNFQPAKVNTEEIPVTRVPLIFQASSKLRDSIRALSSNATQLLVGLRAKLGIAILGWKLKRAQAQARRGHEVAIEAVGIAGRSEAMKLVEGCIKHR